jgi:hypothetical protein
MAVKTHIMVLWVTAFSLVDGYQHFGGTHCFHFQGTASIFKMEAV